jgi:hypothetical protein
LCAKLVLLQAVERGNFAGQRAQRCHLHIAVVRNLRHLLVVFAKILAVLPIWLKLSVFSSIRV